MSPTSCCRTDFLLGFLHHLAHASDRAGLELLGLSIGDQSPFDKHLGHRPSGRSDQRPYHQCTGTDPKAGNQIAAVHDIVKSGQSPHSVAYTAGFNQFDRFVSIGPSLLSFSAELGAGVGVPCATERRALPDEPAISPRKHAIGVTRASLISHPRGSLSAGRSKYYLSFWKTLVHQTVMM